MGTTLFTVGYEGLTSQRFIGLLIAYGIDLLIDVRYLPLSRKRGFSKKSLESAVSRVNIAYLHLKSLGCPPNIRHEYREDGDWHRYTIRYNALLETRASTLSELNILAGKKRCALLCFEANAQLCHRSLIAHRLKQQWDTELSIIHITTETYLMPIQTTMAELAVPLHF